MGINVIKWLKTPLWIGTVHLNTKTHGMIEIPMESLLRRMDLVLVVGTIISAVIFLIWKAY